MPAELGNCLAFDALIPARCTRNWISTPKLEQAISAGYHSSLFRARLRPSKSRNEYDKMIKRQGGRRSSASRREEPKFF